MSFLSGKKAAAATPNQLNSINVDQSRYGDPIPLVYGVQRIPMTLLWYGAFTSTAQYSGGSGKGGRGPPSSYSYTASCVMALCEGPIAAVLQVWKDKDITTLATEDLTLFLGAHGQAIWPYLTSNFPSQAVPYDLTAYVAEANLALGSSAALPNYTFEVEGLFARPGTPISFVSGLAANSYQGQIQSPSPIADGQWDITFSDHESRTCQVVTTGSTTIASWDTTLGLINGVTSAATAGGYDAQADLVLIDYCTDVNHGAEFPYLNIPQIQTHSWTSGGTTYYDNFQTYCIANGLYFSPWEDTQRAATDFVKDLLEMSNSNAVMSAGVMNIVPYGDSAITGNGVTYTPNLQPLFSFTDDDLRKNNQGTNDDPVVVTRKPLTDTYNVVRVEFLDRGNSYNTALAEWTDPLDIAVNGIRVMPNKTFHGICDARVAGYVAALIGQRQLYIRNTYQFTVRADYSILEPMDLIALTDSSLGLVDRLLRITEIEDDENDIFTITAEEMFVGTASAPKYNFQSAQGYAANFATPAFSVAAPVVFLAPPALVGSNGGYELWIAVGSSGGTYTGSTDGEYGGCDLYASTDGVTFSHLGQISGLARFGGLPTAIGVNDTSINVSLLSTSVAEGLQLTSASASDFANNRALIYVDGEIMGFENATLVGVGEYTLSPVSRGLYGTTPVAHAAGASWARLDEAIFKFAIDPGMVGETIYFKFTAFNSICRAEQTLSEATEYPFTVPGTGQQLNVFGLIGAGVTVNGTSAFKSGPNEAWDASLYSQQGYTNGCSVACYSAQTTYGAIQGFMLGLSTAPAASNSYPNLAYAWYFADPSHFDGMLQIYEAGTFVGNFGTYTTSDFFQIVHDGKHVSYYKNGALIRSVPQGNATFYLQMPFHTPGATAYGIEFTSTTTVVTPFTLIPLSGGVACSGTRAVSNSQGAVGFGTKMFQTKESYAQGCFVSASIDPVAGAQLIGLSTAPALGGTITAGWYPHPDSAQSLLVYNGTTGFGAYVGAAPTASDTFTVTYDNFNFRWYRNSSLIYTQPANNVGPLYVLGDIYGIGGYGFNDIAFGPYSPATPAQFVARGYAFVSDSFAGKLGGSSAWDSDVYSVAAFKTCNLVWKPNDVVNNFMGCLTTSIPGSPTYTGLSYCLHCAAGTVQIYESGTLVGSYGSYAVTDRFSMSYDGSTVTYFHNNASIRTVPVSGLTLYADFVFYQSGVYVNSIDWGPGSVVPVLDTSQLNTGSATGVYSLFYAGPDTESAV